MHDIMFMKWCWLTRLYVKRAHQESVLESYILFYNAHKLQVLFWAHACWLLKLSCQRYSHQMTQAWGNDQLTQVSLWHVFLNCYTLWSWNVFARLWWALRELDPFFVSRSLLGRHRNEVCPSVRLSVPLIVRAITQQVTSPWQVLVHYFADLNLELVPLAFRAKILSGRYLRNYK